MTKDTPELMAIKSLQRLKQHGVYDCGIDFQPVIDLIERQEVELLGLRQSVSDLSQKLEMITN